MQRGDGHWEGAGRAAWGRPFQVVEPARARARAYGAAEAYEPAPAPARGYGAAEAYEPPQRARESDVVIREDELELLQLSGGLSIPGITLPTGFRVGAWIDVGGRSLSANMSDHVSKMHAIGLTDACIMVNRLPSSGAHFALDSVSSAVLGTLSPLLRSGGIDLTLTSWLTADKTYIDGMLAVLPDLARTLGARAIEFDVEEAWSRRTPRGFASHAAAATYLFDAMDSLRDMGIEVGVTVQVDPMTGSSLQEIVRRAHFVVPQAYSTSGHAVGTVYGPQGLQTRAADRLRSVLAFSGPMPMIMGLAGYGRNHWSPQSSRDIMILELQRTLDLVPTAGIQGVRYWSWKWIGGQDGKGGRPSNSYADAFLGDLV